MAKDIPLEFKIVTAVEPEFKLPDYKKIAKEVEAGSKEKEVGENNKETELLDKEIQDVLAELEKHNIKPELKEGEKLEDKVVSRVFFPL